MAEAGTALREDHILSCELSIASARHCILQRRDLFKNRSCFLFAHSDILAMGALNAGQILGLSIPGQLQIVGADALKLFQDFSPQLTTVDLSLRDIAVHGCDLLRQTLEDNDRGPIQMVIRPMLVPGETTR